MKKVFKVLVLGFILLLGSCVDEPDLIEVNQLNNSQKSKRINMDYNRAQSAINQYGGSEFQTSVFAEIQDIDGNPLAGVQVAIGEVQTYTNSLGIAFIPNVTLKDKFGYVTAKKEGYFEGSRAFIPNSLESGMANQVKIKLFSMNSPTIIDSEGQNVVTVDTPYGNGSVIFNGGFTDNSGKPYNGSVKVYTAYIDPLNSETQFTMPGDLLGLSTNNEINVLGSFGMVNVKILGGAGQELQIVNPAEIRLPIANEQLADAPDEIPMWYFNEPSGLWIEEGVGQKQGNEYVGFVNHFTSWNYDISLPPATLIVFVKDQFGNPLNSSLKISTTGFTRNLLTILNGSASGLVPANMAITVTASNTSCVSSSFTTTVSPISVANSATVNITLTVSNPSTYTITGTLYDCLAVPLAAPTGWVGVIYNGSTLMLPTTASGGYSHTFTSCSTSSIDVFGLNRTTAVITPTSTVTLVSGTTTTHDVYFPTCEYIEYSINGGPIKTDNINPGGGFTGLSSFQIQAEDSSSNTTSLVSQTTAVGSGYTYGSGPNQLEFVSLADPLWTGSINHKINFDIVNIGLIGDPIEVTFTGTFEDSFGTTHTIIGRAYIGRDF